MLVAELHWVVSGAVVSCNKGQNHGTKAVESLLHEVKVHTELLPALLHYLRGVSGAPRAKFLLNVPECIFHEDGRPGGKAGKKLGHFPGFPGKKGPESGNPRDISHFLDVRFPGNEFSGKMQALIR